MLPGILNQLGAESFSSLKKLASTVAGTCVFIIWDCSLRNCSVSLFDLYKYFKEKNNEINVSEIYSIYHVSRNFSKS